jgi:hypothetical protein
MRRLLKAVVIHTLERGEMEKQRLLLRIGRLMLLVSSFGLYCESESLPSSPEIVYENNKKINEES